jgi:hypothetical protein
LPIVREARVKDGVRPLPQPMQPSAAEVLNQDAAWR